MKPAPPVTRKFTRARYQNGGGIVEPRRPGFPTHFALSARRGATLLLGFVGVNAEFPVLGPLLGGNPFHHFIGGLAETLEIELAHLPFSWTPVLFSLVVALGGLGLGWLIYGRAGKGWQTHDQLDPVEAGMRKMGLGGLYNAMRGKFYFDELYNKIIIAPAMALSRASAWFDRTIINRIVDTVGRFGNWLAYAFAGFDSRFIDGIVNGLGSLANRAGSMLRLVQTGQGQTYLLVALLTVLMLLALFAVQIAGIGVVG